MSAPLHRYRLIFPGDAPVWAKQLEAQINNIFIRMTRDMRPKRYAVADLPDDDSERLAIVTDETGGVTLAFYDGADWRRVQDRAVVS